jgi:predicted RND superfamily exporter protein
MNTSRNRIVNFNSGINLAKEHEKNLKNEALNMQLKIMGQNLNLNERVSDLYNLKSLIKRNQTIIDEKRNILNTRDVQLENTINKTIFNKKVLYVFICIIIALLIVILLFYSFTKK